MAGPAYTRLAPDDRRRQLLDRAVELFAEHGYDELSMAAFAKAAGISKPLLYHYFPSKRDLFEAALEQAAEEHLAKVAPDTESLDVYLDWIEANPAAHTKLMRSAGIPAGRELIDRGGEEAANRTDEGPRGARPGAR